MPDLKQHTLSIVPPLAVPKPQLLDVLRQKKLLPAQVAGYLARHPLLETIQLNR
jgi:hypothetical protein